MNQTGKQRVFYYPPFSCFVLKRLPANLLIHIHQFQRKFKLRNLRHFHNIIQYATVTVTITVSLCLFNTMLLSWLTIYVSMESLLT